MCIHLQKMIHSVGNHFLAAGCTDHTIKIWDLQSKELKYNLEGHKNHVTCVCFSPDGARLLTGSEDKMIRVWEFASNNWNCTMTLKEHKGTVKSLVYSFDGKRFVSASQDKQIKVWCAEKFTVLSSLKGHKGGVYSIAINKDGTTLVSGSADNTVKVWDAISYSEVSSYSIHDNQVNLVSFTPCENYIISASEDKTIKVFDWKKHTELCQSAGGHQSGVQSFAVSDNGAILTSSCENQLFKCKLKL